VHYLLVALFLAHGVAHLVGFLSSWKLGETGRSNYKTTILAGRVDLGAGGIRALGLWWVVFALGFIASAVLVLLGQPASFATALASASGSALLCALYWPDARIGFFLNVAIILVVVFRPGVA
jgi:hypothetical protein